VSTSTIPAVPLTLEGAAVLHQLFRIDWSKWNLLDSGKKQSILAEAKLFFAKLESANSALFSILGHKGDLMLVHFRPSFPELNEVELAISKLELNSYLTQTTSYVSVVELGLYESTQKIYAALMEQDVIPNTPEWAAGVQEKLAHQKTAMAPRLFPEVPARKYICFYPMDRKRGEQNNWYMEPLQDRARLMHEHGMVGRRYADVVKQIISGSIGFDDWEWGVTLFADDPLVFKKLIYEMRFDEVSAVYAEFGQFFFGLRQPASDLDKVF
jgi:hydrogen peroxide-dependent heme synthase